MKRLASPHTIGLLAMHHIYNGEKKEHIETRASMDNLTGRFLYGKPGMVVVEGSERAVGRYIRFIRGLRWQACVCMGRIARAHDVDTSLPHWEQPVPLDAFVEVPNEHFVVRGDDVAVPHPSERLWHAFDPIESPEALEAELSDRGIALAWKLLNRGFRDAHLPPPPDGALATESGLQLATAQQASASAQSSERPKARRRRKG